MTKEKTNKPAKAEKETSSTTTDELQTLHIRVPKRLVDIADVYCDKRFMNRTTFIINAIVEKLQKEGFID